MSLSRPVKHFPLLKLPWLCIKDVVKSWDIVDIIFFALLSQKTRQIVKLLKIPLNGIEIFLSDHKWIELGSSSKKWHLRIEGESDSFFQNRFFFEDLREVPLVLQKNAIPLYTSRTDNALESYTDGNEITASKMAMEFLNEVFKCSVEGVNIHGDNFPESGDIGVRSTMNLHIAHLKTHSFDHAQSQKLNLMLENLEVTSTCALLVHCPKRAFHCDPKLFKCKKLEFWSFSSLWITRDLLFQFEVPRLYFDRCWLSVKDIISFITQWFHSDNKKFEYLYNIRSEQISLEKFQKKNLNPLPFSGRNRVPLSETFGGLIDFSKGLEIVRQDGLEATIHVTGRDFLFYIWHP